MPRQISEEATRKQMKVPPLEPAGWYLRDYSKVKIVGRRFKNYTQYSYNANQIRFLRAAQSVFLEKRYLEPADVSTGSTCRLYEPPLDMFGADAVERWFTEKEVKEMVLFTNKLAIQ